MNLLRDWDQFWFTPRSTLAISLCRIVLGALAALKIALLWPDRAAWFYTDGAVTPSLGRILAPPPRLCLLDYVSSDWAISAFLVVAFLVALLFTAGVATRWTNIALFACLISLDHRNELIVQSGDNVLSIMLFFMVFAPAGATLSIDRVLGILHGRPGGHPAPRAFWAQRLMQFQLSMIYLSAVFIKMRGTDYPAGTAVYWMTRLVDRHRMAVPVLSRSMIGFNLLSYQTLLTELAMGTLVWWPRARPYVLLAGVILHLGIEWSMNVGLFSFIMIGCYLVFVDGATVSGWLAWARKRVARRPGALVFNGAVDRQRRVAAAVGALDGLGWIEIIDASRGQDRRAKDGDAESVSRCVDGLRVKDAQGRWLDGPDVLPWLAGRLPLLWPVVPLLRLSPLRDLAYRTLGSRPVRRLLLPKVQ